MQLAVHTCGAAVSWRWRWRWRCVAFWVGSTGLDPAAPDRAARALAPRCRCLEQQPPRAVMQREAAHWAACWYSCVAERQVARYEWCAGSGAGSMHEMGAGIAGVLVRALCAGELRAVVVMQWRFIPAGLKRWRSSRRHFCRHAAKPAIRQWRRLAGII